MTKVVLKCALSMGDKDLLPGDTLEVDDDNLSRMLRKNMAQLPPKPAPKKKKKAELAAE
jgi:hypothetical protein|tara:strand:- start:1891 stop:2067 length:177 start_codon:yes stop_codon:yes gene_type:complete